MSRKKAKQHYCGVGGQAVLDGIMMRNGNDYAIAVRKTDGTIAVEKKVGKKKEKSILSRIPFVRGVVNFIDSLWIGFQSLNFSAEIGMEDLEEEPGRFERFLKKHFGDKANDIIMSFTVFAAVILAVAVFIMLPYGLAAFAGQYIQSSMLLSVFEGVLRLLIFIGYVTLIGLMEDINRMYMYHGAEHKCINCIERGKPLTVRNVRRSSRLHPRCGTSFMLYVMVISCVCFFFVQAANPLLRLLYRLLLIPVIAAVSYELIQLAGRSSNPIVRLLNLPGMGMQMLSTREPDDEMIEVAIQAVEAVFDWEGYQEVVFGAVETEDAFKEEEPEGNAEYLDGEEENEYQTGETTYPVEEITYAAAVEDEAATEFEFDEETEAEAAAVQDVVVNETSEENMTEFEDGIAEAPEAGTEYDETAKSGYEAVQEAETEYEESEEAEAKYAPADDESADAFVDDIAETTEMEYGLGKEQEPEEEEPEEEPLAESEEESEEEPLEEPEEEPEAYPGEEFAEESEEDEIQRENAEILAYLDRLIAEEMKQDSEEDADETDAPENNTDAADTTGNDDAADDDDGAPDSADGTDGAYRVRSEEEAGREIEELLEHDL
ncbi:MAG: DUF1385 domain-containing protein [Lachnospiraceae bacterium]|nr:DUF1385 domain-containing protein [Lachnospiraceae bacterium]